MRKIVILFFISTILLSCKKARTCRCSVTLTYSNGQLLSNSKTTMLAEKYTKKQATAVCKAEEDHLEITYKNIYTNNGAQDPNATADARCLVE